MPAAEINQVDRTHNGDGKSSFSYEKLADTLILNPRLSRKELSELFGYTESWISIVMHSDAFKVVMQRRKGDLVDPILRATIEDHYKALAAKSCHVLMEKLSAPVHVISDDLALRAAALGAQMFKAAPPVPQAPESSIDKLADRLIALQQGLRGTTLRTPEIVEGNTV